MHINVIDSSTPEVHDYLYYPDQHPGTYAYIQNQFQNIGSTILESGRQFIEQSKTMFAQFYDHSIERAAKAAIRMAKGLVNPNSIQRYDTLEDIQSAPPLMQRYIMAEPYIREKFHQQLCSGFAGSYIDPEPGFLREQNYDWRRIHNGIVRYEGEGENEQWVSTTYCEDLRGSDRELTFDEQIDILSVHEIARLFAKEGFDPTCPFGGKIG